MEAYTASMLIHSPATYKREFHLPLKVLGQGEGENGTQMEKVSALLVLDLTMKSFLQDTSLSVSQYKIFKIHQGHIPSKLSKLAYAVSHQCPRLLVRLVFWVPGVITISHFVKYCLK